MPLDPNIALSYQPPQLPDYNALAQQSGQNMMNIMNMQNAIAERQAGQQAAQDAAMQKALSPALAAAFSNPTDEGLVAAFDLVPDQYKEAAKEQLVQLQSIPDPVMRKNVLRTGLAQYDFGKTILAQLEPTANMALQAKTAEQRAAIDQQRLALDKAKLEAEAASGKKVSFRETDAEGNVHLFDEQGNELRVVKGAGKPATPPSDKTQESERLAAYNAGRALNAAKRISEAAKTSPDAEAPGWLEATASAVGNPNIVRSEDRQIVVAAQRDLIDALLTLATGAAYNKEQLEGQMESYIPKWSDKPKARANKRQALLDLIATAKTKAGRAWTPEMEATFQGLVAGASEDGTEPSPTAAQSALPEGTTTTNW